MRVCEYTVVSEINDVVKELDKVVYTSKAGNLEPDYDPASDGSDYYDNGWNTDENDDYNESECDDSTCQCHQEEHEYRAGYKLGVSDSKANAEYQTSVDIDASDDFKTGYKDGWYDNETDKNL